MMMTIGGKSVPITSEVTNITINDVINSIPFQSWIKEIDIHVTNSLFEIHSICIQSVDMFGPNVGFVKFKVNATRNGRMVPGIVFMRGNSVAVLPIIKTGDKYYTILCEQLRIPAAGPLVEICAGMQDGNSLKGAAVNELQEELEIKINAAQLIDVCEFLGANNGLMYLTPGGSDEAMRFYVFVHSMSLEKLNAKRGKVTGIGSESIKLVVKEFNYALLEDIRDLKSMFVIRSMLDNMDKFIIRYM